MDEWQEGDRSLLDVFATMSSIRHGIAMLTLSRLRRNLLWGVTGGLVVGAVYALVATGLLIVQGSAVFDANGLTYGSAVLGYFAAGAAAGAVVGIARPLTRSRVGAYFVGALSGIIGMVPIGSMISGPPWHWGGGEFMLLVISGTVLGGGVLGPELRGKDEARHN